MRQRAVLIVPAEAPPFSRIEVFVLDLAEKGRRPDIRLRLFGRCGRWIAPSLHDGAIQHVRDWPVDRRGLVDRSGMLQQSELPIGNLGELSDGIRQRRDRW